MSDCLTKFILSVKFLKSGFVANDKWLQAPSFDLLHYNYRSNKMSDYLKKLNIFIKLLPTKFVANDNWLQAPGFDLFTCI